MKMNLFAEIRALVVASLDDMVASGALPAGLDMGAVATDLIIIDGDRIWSRPVPIGALLADAFEKVGGDGVISIEENSGMETSL